MADTKTLSPPASAVLDEAHLGDIHGAFGTIRRQDTGARTSWRARLVTLLAVMGPGLIVMVGDNDAGGVATYAQAGQNFGTSLLWVLLLLIPVLIVNQEMVVRLGLVTGVGHARLIMERFGKFWAAFSVGDLFILNFLTIVTEFIGISLAMAHFGVSPYISVPVAAAGLLAITMTGSFRRWEQFMYIFVVTNFLAVPLAIMSHPAIGPVVHDFVIPGIRGGLTSTAMLLIIGIVGTTVAPWQLFFQQSNVIDKRLTPRWMDYERLDTIIGAFVVVIGAAALMIVAAFGLGHGAFAGRFVNAGTVASELAHTINPVAGDFFAILLLNASIIGAAAVTLSTSYAFGDVFGIRHSLHRTFRDAMSFYLIYACIVLIAAGIVLIPRAPLGLITLGVQALAGLLLPSASVFLLLLCNDPAVLGPWVNRAWLNAVATLIITVLVMLSLILGATTMFPSIDVTLLTLVVGCAGGVALVVAAGLSILRGRGATPEPVATVDRQSWRMPSLALLSKPVWSPARKASMLGLQAYLGLAVIMMVVKVVQLAGG